MARIDPLDLDGVTPSAVAAVLSAKGWQENPVTPGVWLSPIDPPSTLGNGQRAPRPCLVVLTGNRFRSDAPALHVITNAAAWMGIAPAELLAEVFARFDGTGTPDGES